MSRAIHRWRKIALLLAVLAPALALQAPAQAQIATANTPLAFGIVASDVAVAGTVVVNANTQAVTTTGGALTFGGSTGAASFTVGRDGSGGNNAQTITVSWPTSITVSNGTQTATVSNITCHFVSGNADTNFNCVNGGTMQARRNQTSTFRLGGTLVLPANQARGNYSGTLTVTAN